MFAEYVYETTVILDWGYSYFRMIKGVNLKLIFPPTPALQARKFTEGSCVFYRSGTGIQRLKLAGLRGKIR